jgi:hypothetical protein
MRCFFCHDLTLLQGRQPRRVRSHEECQDITVANIISQAALQHQCIQSHLLSTEINYSIARTSATHLANDDASAHAHPSNIPRHIHTQLMQAKPHYHSFNQLYLLIITANRMRTYRLHGILTIYSSTPHYVYIVKAAKPPPPPKRP